MKSDLDFQPGDRAHLYGDICEIVRIKNGRTAVVFFTGRTTDGKFGHLHGGLDCFIGNLQPYPTRTTGGQL